MKPITPEEVVEKKRESLPDFVIDAFNKLIAERWDGRDSSFKQDDVIALIVGHDSALAATREEIFSKHYLDVEDIYREAGWGVLYEKPGYNETGPAVFRFTKKKP
jgi:hypothetical protein